MICKVYNYCPIQKNCENCPQWYKSYVKTCKEEGKEPTDMRPKQFHSYEVTPVKGEDMTWEETSKMIDEKAMALAQKAQKSLNRMSYEEAAKELGVKVQTIQKYISMKKLELASSGYVTKESVEKYKRKKLKNMAKISEMMKAKKTSKSDNCANKTDNNQATVKQIKPLDEATKKDDPNTEYIVTKGELKDALDTAFKLGFEKGKSECKREKLELKDILSLIEN